MTPIAVSPVSDRPSLADEVHAKLVEAVCSGGLPPGAPLRQEKLAADLNVSRQPVIQALAMLRRDGLVEPAGKRGYRVAPVDADLVRHVYQMRSAFDGLAARLAALRPAAVTAPVLNALLAEGEAAVASGDTDWLVNADLAFHTALYDLADNPLLPDVTAPILQQVRRVMHAVLRRPDERAPVWDEHRAMVTAILDWDADAAERAARNHVDRAADRLIACMTEN